MTDKPTPKKPSFRTNITMEAKPNTPEGLFQDLKSRSPKIQHLWAHQADLLRAYDMAHIGTPDIALELPTGTGKTLIGLLLAEYRRRKFGDRPLYLCPTRQLAHQVAEHAKEYGIGAKLLLPRDYEGLQDFTLGSAVGISTYSALFNTNPRIKDPQIIILDDAHSSEDYIAGLWSVRITRRDKEPVYRELLTLIRPELEGWFADRMLSDDYYPDEVELLPFPRFWENEAAIRGLLDEKTEGDDQRFPWSMIYGNLHACCFYICWHEILIRPYIPPTMTHPPFADARQRIYMSATLGEGGELERITGVRKIERLPVSEGWSKRNSGRRLFLFPNMSLNEEEISEVIVDAIRSNRRGLVLTPSLSESQDIKRLLDANDIRVMESQDIAESMDGFTSAENVALVLANRYDGIDLPGEDCRLLILANLPAGTNVQERFLLSRLAAISLLRDRLRTRFTQAVGRCCRSSNDYATVIVVGQSVFDFCARRENQAGMHPELQAEISFGLENSGDMKGEELIGLMSLLNERGEDWSGAEAEIIRLRDGCTKLKDPFAEALMKVARLEVDFTYDLWKKDFEAALKKANEISDLLEGSSTDGYRAWWYYLGGCVAWLGGKSYGNVDLLRKAENLFGRAARCSKSISWFSDLARLSRQEELPLETDPNASKACETVHKRLDKMGYHGQTFERAISDFQTLIGKNDADPFERGLVELGKLLGFDSYRPTGNGAPDPVWYVSDRLAVVFEAKSDESKDHAISIGTVRQALTHGEWVRRKHKLPPEAEVVTVVVSPRRKIEPDAKLHAGGLFYMHVDDVRAMAEKVVASYRRVRSMSAESDQAGITDKIHEELDREALLPGKLLKALKRTPLESL